MITLRSFSLVMSIVLLRHWASQLARPFNSDIVDFNIHWVLGACVLFSVAGKALAVTAAFRVPQLSPSRAWREFEQQRTWLEWIWLVTQAWLLPASGLGAWLSQAEHAGWSTALLMIGWFLPSLIFMSALELSLSTTGMHVVSKRQNDEDSSVATLVPSHPLRRYR